MIFFIIYLNMYIDRTTQRIDIPLCVSQPKIISRSYKSSTKFKLTYRINIKTNSPSKQPKKNKYNLYIYKYFALVSVPFKSNYNVIIHMIFTFYFNTCNIRIFNTHKELTNDNILYTQHHIASY